MNTETIEEIQKYLQFNGSEHLCDCLDLIPVNKQEQLYRMITAERNDRVPKTMVAYHVAEDVAALVEGKPEKAVFSRLY